MSDRHFIRAARVDGELDKALTRAVKSTDKGNRGRQQGARSGTRGSREKATAGKAAGAGEA